MRAIILSPAIVLILSAGFSGAEELYLSRTLDLDFRRPGKITSVSASGSAPVSEQVLKNSYVLVLPKRVKLTLSIANDNEDRHHYHICVRIQDELLSTDKVEEVIRPENLIRHLWLAQYRCRFTLVRKHAARRGRFITATLKLDVHAPGPKKPPAADIEEEK